MVGTVVGMAVGAGDVAFLICVVCFGFGVLFVLWLSSSDRNTKNNIPIITSNTISVIATLLLVGLWLEFISWPLDMGDLGAW